MTLRTAQYTVNALTPTRIVAKSVNPQRCLIHNHEHASNLEMFIGTSTVSKTTGLHIPPTERVDFILNPNEELFAITDKDTAIVHVFVQGD